MNAVRFTSNADSSYRKASHELAAWADTVVDQLEIDPTVKLVREKRFDVSRHWGAQKRLRGEKYWLLWFLDEATGEVVVDYLGPAARSAT